MKTTTKTNPSSTKRSTVKTVVIVSLLWIAIGATVVGYVQNGQAQYNKGVFDGMTKTKAILQSK